MSFSNGPWVSLNICYSGTAGVVCDDVKSPGNARVPLTRSTIGVRPDHLKLLSLAVHPELKNWL